jgi:hypothetical protein
LDEGLDDGAAEIAGGAGDENFGEHDDFPFVD